MDNNTPSTGMIHEYVDDEIKRNQQDALSAAQAVDGTSQVEAGTTRANTEKQFAGRSTLGIMGEAAVRTEQDVNLVGALERELTDRSRHIDDDAWNPRVNQDQQKQLTTELEQSGLPQEMWNDALGAGSLQAARAEMGHAKQELESLKFIGDAGYAGMVPMFAASMLDLDAPIGLGIFGGLRKAAKVAKIAKLVEAGKMTEVEAKAARMTASYGTRTQNMMMAAEAGATSALVSQGGNAMLRPTVDASDVWGAVLLSAGIGGTAGSMVPKGAKLMEDVVDTSNLAKDARLANDASIATKKPMSKAYINNNPGNIEFNPANEWQGQKGIGPDGRFAQFETPEDGVRAMHVLLTNYGKRGVDTVQEILSTYAPKSENDTAAYISKVSKELGVAPDQHIDLTDMDTSMKLVSSLIKHETGKDASKFTPQMIQEGIARSLDPNKEPVVTRTFKNMREFDPEKSVGAAALPTIDVAVSPSTHGWDNHADQFWDNNQQAMQEVHSTVHETWADTPVGKLGRKIHEGLKKTPFISDYDRLRGLESNVGNWFLYQTLESPLGIARNRRSANNLSHHMYETVAEEVSPSVGPLYRDWAKDKGVKMWSLDYHRGAEKRFQRELMEEMEARYHDGMANPNAHPSIKQLADNYDVANKKMLDYAAGRDGQPAVKGMDEVEFKTGWFRRKWRGDKMSELERQIGTDRMIQAISTGMTKVNPDLDVDMALIFSKAIVRRARDKLVGSGFGEFGSISDDGKAFMSQALMDHAPNMSPDEAMSTVERVFGMNPERGKLGFARGRIDIDLRTPIDGTNNTLMDLIDGDITANQERYYRAASNYAALARKGIQKTDLPSIKHAILEQAGASGTLNKGTGKLIDDIFSYFGEGAYAGGSGPVAGRLNKLSIMSYLGNLGITQTAEIGAGMGAVGLKSYAHYAGQTIPDMLKGKDPDVLKSLQSIGVYTGDHKLVVRAISADDMDLDTSSKLLTGLDRASDKGMRALGYISGFYKVTEIMNTVAALSGQDYMVRAIRDGKNMSRLKDMGVDDAMHAKVKSYIDNGTVEFTDDGLVKDMHYEQWAPEDQLDAALAIKTHVRNVVQKPQRGESSNWMHGQVGSLLMNLKSFVVISGQKQLLRNMRHGDTEALMTLLYGTGTAAMAFSARQILDGKSEQLTPMNVARGAIQWGNMTAPALMIMDPLSYMLGADRIPGSPFPTNSSRYGQGGLVSMPAGLSALGQVAGLGRIPSDFIDDGHLGGESINSIKAMPVLGRSYPMTMMLNGLTQKKE